jgi:ribosomal protein S18 acetylase RimI-like enzyme
MGSNVQVRSAGPADVAAIGRWLGRAFRDDPIFEFLSPGLDVDTRAHRCQWFFRAEAAIRTRQAAVWTTPDGTGAAIWAPPGRWRMTLGQTLRLAVPILRGARANAVRGLSALSAIEKAHPHDPPHWYLAVLGTDPDHQGRGIGSALLQPVLDRCDEDGLGAYLESSKEANIPFYERHGFTVVQELPLGKGAPPVWPMWRDPRPPGEG